MITAAQKREKKREKGSIITTGEKREKKGERGRLE